MPFGAEKFRQGIKFRRQRTLEGGNKQGDEAAQTEWNFGPAKILPLVFKATTTRFLFKTKLNTVANTVDCYRA